MSRLLINENPLQVLPSLACAIGLNEAVVLQQIHYWMNSTRHFCEGRRWVYNSVANWQKQFPFWSEATIKRALSSLEQQGMIVSGNYNTDPRNRSKWYSINYQSIEALEKQYSPVNNAFGQIDQMEQIKLTKCNESGCTNANGQDDPMQVVNMTQPLPENTTEITTENKNNTQPADAAVQKINTSLHEENKIPPSVSAGEKTPTAGRYAFEGKVIRLNQEDYASWKTLFANIDLDHYLRMYDLEFSHDNPKKWFMTLNAKLNYQNEQARKNQHPKGSAPTQGKIELAEGYIDAGMGAIGPDGMFYSYD